MKKTIFKQKRFTLLPLLLRTLALALALMLIFAVALQIYIYQSITQQVREEVNDCLSGIQKRIENNNYLVKAGTKWNLRFTLATYDFFAYLPGSEYPVLETSFSPDCSSAVMLLDSRGDVLASNQLFLWERLWFSDLAEPIDDQDARQQSFQSVFFFCDPEELPEADQIFADYLRYMEEVKTQEFPSGVTVELFSAYLNRETHTYLPRSGNMDYGSYQDGFVVDANLPGYSLEVIHPGELWDYDANSDYVYSGVGGLFGGESREVLEKLGGIKPYCFGTPMAENRVTVEQLGGGLVLFDGVAQVEMEGKPCWLNVRIQFNYRAPMVVRYFWTRTLLFAGVVTVLSIAWCCWRYWREKAVMEKVRRSLTDTLAHDIKTPLMAISGYTENVLKGKLTEAEEKEYLYSILDNVAYTDNLISRTLYLNHMEQGKKGKPEAVQLAPLAEKLLTKYDLMLREKRIQTALSGGAELQADPAALETILENLISNAVKYTPEGGKIQIKMDKKTLTVTNTVTQKLDVKKLKEPFVRGDAARSNVKGNGLGLAIADRAAKANGFKLKLSCTDTEFQAELKF